MADPQAPWTSGSEILANPGNANLASGSGSGSLPIQVDPKPIYSVLDRLGDEEVKRRFQQEALDREDKAALAKTLADIGGKGGSAFNMKGADGSNVSFSPLPDDQKVLQSKADELRQSVLKNPDNYEYDPAYLRKKEEYNYLLQHAGKRAILHSQNRLGAQQAADPEDREGYLKANQDEILAHPLTDFHEPNSYLQKQPTDLEAIQSQKERENKENNTTMGSKVENGYQTDKFGLTNEVADVRSRMIPGTKAYVEGVKLSQSFIRNYAQHPGWVEDMNAKILENNAERGLKPGDAHYQPPVAIVKPDGTVGFLSTDPAQITGAIFFASHGGISTDVKPSNLDEQRKKSEADIKHQKNEEGLQWANYNDKVRHEKEMEAAAREKGDAKAADEMAAVNAPVHTYLKFAEDARAKATNPIPGQSVQILQAAGINPSDYTYTPINPSDAGVGNIAAVKKVDSKGAHVGYGQPSAAIYLKSKTGGADQDMVMVSYEETPEKVDKKTNVITPAVIRWKTIKPNEAVENIIKTGKTGVTDKTLLNVDRSQNKLNEYFSGGQKASNTVQLVDKTLDAHKDLEWVKRLYDPNPETIQVKGQKFPSTHLMSWGESDGKYYVFPSIQKVDGKLKDLGKGAFDYSLKNKTAISFDTKEDAKTFAENGYKQGTGVTIGKTPKVIKAGQEKQIGTTTYVQDANGDWHKK